MSLLLKYSPIPKAYNLYIPMKFRPFIGWDESKIDQSSLRLER